MTEADTQDRRVRRTWTRLPFTIGAVVIALMAVGLWYWLTRGRESTDDAQVDGLVTQVSARVGGTIVRVSVEDNQVVDVGALLVTLDPRDYEVAVDRARAELANAEAVADAARTNVPITSTTTAGNVSSAKGAVTHAQGGVAGAEQDLAAAQARLTTAEARLRQAQANAANAARDTDRLRVLHANDEVSQQEFDRAATAAEALRAAADSARSQVAEAQAGVPIADSKVAQAHATELEAHAALQTAQTAPQQVAMTKASAAAADARVQQARANLAQVELNLQYATVRSPIRGVVSKKGINTGQVVQAGQPLLAIVDIDHVWFTANFKETQLAHMRPGQRVIVDVDAFGGRTYDGTVDSVAGATGSRFSLLPPENATGNYVKVVQRVPVKLVLNPGQDQDRLLRPGMSVVPTVFTREGP